MIPLSPALIKNVAIVVVCVGLLLGCYYKGHHDASVAYELENKQAQIEVANKLAKIEALSASIAQTVQENTSITNQKLDSVLLKYKGKTLTSVPCTPSKEFSAAWSEFNSNTK